jgi:hypothetical protein
MNGYALSFIQISKSHVRLKPEVEKDWEEVGSFNLRSNRQSEVSVVAAVYVKSVIYFV